MKKRIRGRLSGPVRNKGSGGALCDNGHATAHNHRKVVEEPCPSCIGEKLGTKADQPSGWNPEFEADPAVAIVVHLLHPAFTDPHLLCHDPYEFLRNIDDQMLHGLVKSAVHVFCNALRHRHGKLIAFPPDHLDQDRKLQFPSSHHLERIGGIKVNLDRHIIQELLFKPIPQVSRCDILSILAGKRRCIHRKNHGDGGLIHRNSRKRLRDFQYR